MDDTTVQKIIQDMLAQPWRWRVISSLFAPDMQPVRAPVRKQGSHHHPHREALICLAGEGLYGLGHHVYPFSHGTVFLFDAFEPHDLGYPSTSADLDHLWIMLVGGQYLARLNSIRAGRIVLGTEWLLTETQAGVSLNRHWSDILAHPYLPVSLRRIRMTSAVALLLAAISEQSPPAETMDRMSFQKEVIAVVQQHIRDTGGNGAGIAHLAHMAGYSPFHFLRLFRRYVGMSVHEYVTNCRLERSRELMKSGLTRKQISEALGFSCPSTFSRWLRHQRERGNDV